MTPEQKAIAYTRKMSGWVPFDDVERFGTNQIKDAHLAGQQSALTWIPVKDWTPVFNRNILGYSKHGFIRITFYDSSYTLDDQEIQPDDEYTHLMPLPQPPVK